MKQQAYGRIVIITSVSGLYGNFGQANYGAAKMAVAGLMNTLAIEGAKYNIHVNSLAPTAATRMTEDLIRAEILAMLVPEAVTAGALTLCHDNAPSRFILCTGGGGYAKSSIFETDGIYLSPDQQNPDAVTAHWDGVCDTANQAELETGGKQSENFLLKAYAFLQDAK